MALEKLYIVGFGVGDKELFTDRAKNIVQSANRILGTSRMSQSEINTKSYKLSELMLALEKPIDGTTVVLVSGDCCFFSVSKNIVERFKDAYEIELINGISSLQYFCAKIKTSYDDAKLVSMHGRDNHIVSKVSYNKKVFALTGGEFKVQTICSELARCGLGGARVSIGENLSYPEERIVCGVANDFTSDNFLDLAVMLIENENAVSPHKTLFDKDFIRGDVPMTKEEVRWVSVQKLGIAPTDICYDIGAGTGSVSVEMARKAFDGIVYAIEMKESAVELIFQNRKKHGAFNLEVIKAKAPESLETLPIPNKVFIGGSAGNIFEIVKTLVARNPQIKIVANAIALQSLHEILESFQAVGFTQIETICVNVSKSKKIGAYDMMMAQNPIYIITASWED